MEVNCSAGKWDEGVERLPGQRGHQSNSAAKWCAIIRSARPTATTYTRLTVCLSCTRRGHGAGAGHRVCVCSVLVWCVLLGVSAVV